MPDPKPAKHAEAERDGTSPTGHGPDGNASHSAPAPPRPADAATARTTATERAAGTPPNAEAWTTRAAGHHARTQASTPEAQPVTTAAEAASCPSAHWQAASDAREGAREPETPTTEAERSAAVGDVSDIAEWGQSDRPGA